MTGFTFENQGVNTYLVYSLGADDALDTLSLGMTTNNKIAGILPIVFTQMDDNKYFKYNISSKVSVKQFFSGAVNKKRLLGVLSSMISGIIAAEEYMIDTSTLVFDLDYIFADVSTCEACMVCMPILNKETAPVDLSLFFKNIVFSTQFDQTENCDYVARIISYLNSTSMFSLADFKRIVDELLHGIPQKVVNAAPQPQPVKPQVIEPPQQNPYPNAVTPSKPVQPVQPVKQIQTPAVPQKPVATPPPVIPSAAAEKPSANMGFAIPGMENAAAAPQKTKNKKEKAEKEIVQKEKKSLLSFFIKKNPSEKKSAVEEINQKAPVQQGLPQKSAPQQIAPQQIAPQPAAPKMSFGETTVLGGSGAGETTVLSDGQSMTAKPFLIRGRNNERIYLDKPVFRIGKEKSYVDYFIPDNAAISRSHANIITRENEYYVVDTNSTNHTYVNGAMLQSNIEIQIVHGAKIRLANEEFEFRLY